MPVLVQRQHLGVHNDLSLLGVAALTQGSPLRGQLAAVGGPKPGRARQAAVGVACWWLRPQGVGGGTGRVSAAPGAR